MNPYDVLIVGGGPAGLTAAIYAGRAQLKVALIERLMPGGQVASTEWVENYPGFKDGIGGAELMQQMEAQAKRFGLEILSDEVQDGEWSAHPKKLIGAGGTYFSKTAILATGTAPRLLNVPGELEFKGRGVSYCATCDGPFFKEKDVVVIGGGNSGIQESLYLSRFVRSIQLVEILGHLSAEKILQERVLQNPKFSFLLGTRVLSINGKQKVESVTVQDTRSGQIRQISGDGVFIWVGLQPNARFLEGKLTLNPWGYIQTDEHMETSVSGVYAAGDVRAKGIRQITTAVNDGTVAAESAVQHLETMNP